MPRDYLNEAVRAANILGIRFENERFTLEDLAHGIEVEYEHGTENSITNVTGDDPLLTAKIALAHLYEDGGRHYDYYDGLEILEHAPVGYWQGVDASNFWMHRRAGRYATAALLFACTFACVHGFVTESNAIGAIMLFCVMLTIYLLASWK